MIRIVEASIDEMGVVRLLEPVLLHATRRALVTILDEEEPETVYETARMSKAGLSDWNRPEEDEAWDYLQQEL